jgi:hypothetical protein
VTSAMLPAIYEAIGDETFIARPSASGPFAGVQGGAVAGLMASLIQRRVAPNYRPLSFRAEFFRPTPIGVPLVVAVDVIQSGRRISVLDARIVTEAKVTARATCTLAAPLSIDALDEDFATEAAPAMPDLAAIRPAMTRAPHGGPWLMDVLDGRTLSDGSHWFRWLAPLLPDNGCTPFARMLGPVDFAHGMARPGLPGRPPVTGWPNTDLSVHVDRAISGEWIGMRPVGRWSKSNGLGIGTSALFDTAGQFGRVTMGVVIIP